ncbi:MAG: ATP synthase F0 subunit B [Deltaproteobacteria bacterium]|nr:ATP synthase F0 subunit B [Deltaproteobacteria bacterium]MBW2014276.1 ATP synthase F0 subunit B [Deltaproteobacteria bacterium]MBW2089710.1 ATP synthase F0 subunit B [Deltaproteobacteria bacterium]MBW2320874.1 ATP synthase F0 subunit B [Deltaproteobacteria bacterium]
MRCVHKIVLIFCCIIAGILSLHFLGYEALAAEKASSWRPIYDLILRWINFGIIVFLVFKYLKTPIMNFLRGQKEKLAQEIKRLEDKKQGISANIEEILKTIDESEVRFTELKERIVRQGEKKKKVIIQTAQKQSKMMLEDAKRRIDTHFIQAKNKFKAEMIDKAIDLAMERLPKEITTEDNEKLTIEYLTLVK